MAVAAAGREVGQYDKWTADPQVGGLLSGYMDAERVRTWLKDGPMKHYANARHGVGPYAEYATTSGPTPQRVAIAALGDGWTVDGGSVRTKPIRFRATGPDGGAATVAYGPSRKFRDPLWAALNDAVDRATPQRCVIVVSETSTSPASPTERREQRALADRCDLEIRWVEFANRAGGGANGKPDNGQR